MEGNNSAMFYRNAETENTSIYPDVRSQYEMESIGVPSDQNASNRSDPLKWGPEMEPGHFMTHVERYAVPLICLLGLVGNSLSFIVFLRKTLRRNSCNLFLAARSLSDNGFIIILFVIWLSSTLDLKLSKAAGICQTIIFLSYVFGCISVWLVVFVTIENYIRICRPFLVNGVCKATNAKLAVGVLVVFVVCCYNFPLWTTSNRCIPNPKYYKFIQVMVYTDTVLTLVLPTLIMSILMAAMARSSVSACKRRRRLRFSKIKNSANPMTKVTTMLLAVTLIFFTLNMPSHVVRLRLMIITLANNQTYITTPMELIFQSISQLLYYLSLAINIVVYFLFGGNFRRTFFGLFVGKRSNVSVQTENSVLSSYNKSKSSQLGFYQFNLQSTNSLSSTKDEDQRMIQVSTNVKNKVETNASEHDVIKENDVIRKDEDENELSALTDGEDFVYPLRRFRSSNI